MKKRFLSVLTLALSAIMVLGFAACGEDEQKTTGGGSGNWYDKEIWMTKGVSTPTEEAVLPTEIPTFSNAAVHDPSVFYDIDSKTYYAFGTHYAVATSTNLMTWTQVASDGQFDKLYDKDAGTYTHAGKQWPKALQEIVQKVDVKQTTDNKGADNTISTTWAPDVMKIGSRYYMYFSITEEFGSGRSAIGRVSARNVMGPYSDAELLVFPEEMGGQPNCIDPELFYDKEGKLWMVYGSFFAGIYIKELTPEGMPVVTDPEAEDYFGKLLWKGDRTGVEGPFIFYNAENDYYYLMVSDGDLNTNYNMHIARSKNPDGPYTDIKNSDLTKDPRKGVKLAGNYKFDGGDAAYALGHNSVIKVDGKYLVVCHVRNALSGMHHLEVRQLFFNKDGWPVMSPNRYCGETGGTVTVEKIAGDFDVILHEPNTAATLVNSELYTFGADGKILKGTEEKGTFELIDGYYVKITLDGVVYNGVVSPTFKNNGKKAVWCMTATSDDGRPIWANGK